MREFLHVDGMASASVYVQELSVKDYQSKTEAMLFHINGFTCKNCTICELAETIYRVVGFKGGGLNFNQTKPGGTLRKLMDVSKLGRIEWQAKVGLEDGGGGAMLIDGS